MVALWIEILLQANVYENEWHGVKYECGSFPTSIKKLSESTGITVQQVRTCLKRLKSTNEITIESTSLGTKISIVKWAEYQGLDSNSNKLDNKPSNKRSTNDQQTINNTIRKKESNKEKNNTYIVLENRSDSFKDAFLNYADMRKRIKKPLTEDLAKKVIKKLEKLSADEKEQIEILDQSTFNYWQGVFPLHHTTARNVEDKLPVYTTVNNRNLSKREEEELMKLMGKDN